MIGWCVFVSLLLMSDPKSKLYFGQVEIKATPLSPRRQRTTNPSWSESPAMMSHDIARVLPKHFAWKIGGYRTTNANKNALNQESQDGVVFGQ